MQSIDLDTKSHGSDASETLLFKAFTKTRLFLNMYSNKFQALVCVVEICIVYRDNECFPLPRTNTRVT